MCVTGEMPSWDMLPPECLIMAAAEVINSGLMCVRCYLSSSSSSSGKGTRIRVTDQHNERSMACQLGQLLLYWDRGGACVSV